MLRDRQKIDCNPSMTLQRPHLDWQRKVRLGPNAGIHATVLIAVQRLILIEKDAKKHWPSIHRAATTPGVLVISMTRWGSRSDDD